MTYLYLDIETIPAQSDDIKARIAANIKPPAAMKKADTIAAWEKDQKATAVEEAIAKTSFNGALGHICCIGWAVDNEVSQSVSIHHHSDEIDILANFFDRVSKDGNKRRLFMTPVGHNIINFDLRFIWQRCISLGVRAPAWLPRDPKPWGGEAFDTMTAWAGSRDTISMDNLSFALGLTGKGEIDGSMVAQMYADGLHEEIAEYCREDVDRTRAIHRKMQVAFGEAA